ncbi:hypothetical protein D3C80_1844550 [compost metagenome]
MLSMRGGRTAKNTVFRGRTAYGPIPPSCGKLDSLQSSVLIGHGQPIDASHMDRRPEYGAIRPLELGSPGRFTTKTRVAPDAAAESRGL